MLPERYEQRLQTFSIDSIISTPSDWLQTSPFTSTTAKPSYIMVESKTSVVMKIRFHYTSAICQFIPRLKTERH
jgi:hypothetical protein